MPEQYTYETECALLKYLDVYKRQIMKQTLSKLRRAVNDYSMINNDDKICVGISGGKEDVYKRQVLR